MSDDEIRAPDTIFKETLINNSKEFLENTNYNEDFELNKAIQESMYEIEDEEYFNEQLDFLNTAIEKEQFEDNEKENKTLRHKSLENLCINLLKIRTRDPNLTDYFYLLDFIINDYIDLVVKINDYNNNNTYNNSTNNDFSSMLKSPLEIEIYNNFQKYGNDNNNQNRQYQPSFNDSAKFLVNMSKYTS
jgi:hypothetical protein